MIKHSMGVDKKDCTKGCWGTGSGPARGC